MRGLGKSQINAREKSKQNLVEFIKNSQPCTSGQIRNNCKIRRNNITKFLEELILEEKLIIIKNHYLTNPPPIDKINKLGKCCNLLDSLSLIRKTSIGFIELVQKQIRFIETQPLRAKLIHAKISPAILNEWKTILKINFDKIVATNDFKQIFEMSEKFQKSFMMYLDDFMVWKWIYRRFEYPRFVDIYTNPHGIEPKFLKDNKLNMKKIDEEFKKNIDSGCCLCGCGLYITDFSEGFIKSQISYDKGKISEDEYRQRLKSIIKNQNIWHRVELPNNKITLQKTENVDIDIFAHIDQTMGKFFRTNISLCFQK